MDGKAAPDFDSGLGRTGLGCRWQRTYRIRNLVCDRWCCFVTSRITDHGFRNFDNYRLCLLLHCGITWHHQTPTPTRPASIFGLIGRFGIRQDEGWPQHSLRIELNRWGFGVCPLVLP